jgi:serine/threonine-protein kinase
MGSYLLILHREGCKPLRTSVRIGRMEAQTLEVTLYEEGSVPEGFVQIPAGEFSFQGDRENPYSGEGQVKEAPDYFIARFPATCAEYLVFLNELAAGDPGRAGRRVPRQSPDAGPYWPLEDGSYVIPTRKWIEGDPSRRNAGHTLYMTEAPWREDWPVMGVSWSDLVAYAAWRSRREEFLFSLPIDVQWEKAARGTDGRFYPWGKEEDATFFNGKASHETGAKPCPVRTFPIDASPYGMRGVSGNVRDWCLNDPGVQYPGWRVARGGGWPTIGKVDHRCTSRTGGTPDGVNHHTGGRLVWLPRTPWV